MGVSIRASDVPIRNSAVLSATMVEDMDLLWDADCTPQRSNTFHVQIRVASALSPEQPASQMENPAAELPVACSSPATSIEKLIGSSSIFKRESQSPQLSASVNPVQIQPMVLSQAGTAKRRLAMPAQDSSAVASGATSPNPKKPNDSHASSLKTKVPLYLANMSTAGSAVTPFRRGNLPALDPRGVHIKESGPPGSLVYRGTFLEGSNWDVSPWHSVPLAGPDGLLNCICTTPTGTWVRHELAPDEPNNPLRVPRTAQRTPGHFWANAPWNIGLLPQTLSDPSVSLDQSGGASCPIEMLDIGATTSRRVGEIYLVKPLAAFAVLPDNSKCLQWKVVAIAAHDPMAQVLEDAADLDMVMPGLLEMVREWLRHPACSTSTAAESLIHLNGCAVGLPQILEVLTRGHEAWQLYTSSLVNSSFNLKGPHSPASPTPSDFICPSIPTCGPTMGLGLFYEPSLFRKEVGHSCTEPNVDNKAALNPRAAVRARQELIANLKYLDQRLSLPAFSPHLSEPAVQSVLGSVKAHLRSAGRIPAVCKNTSADSLPAKEIQVTSDALIHVAERR